MEKKLIKNPVPLKIKNIIFIIADTLRFKSTGLSGLNPSPTPFIDYLASMGINFTNAYASITCTDPSITSLMSGKYPLSIGLVNHARFVTEEEKSNIHNLVLLPEILSKNGFKTIAIDWVGRWHKKGYQFYSNGLSSSTRSDFIMDKIPSLAILMRSFDKISLRTLNREFFINGYYAFYPNPKIPYDPADRVVDEAIIKLKKNEKQKKFIYLHLWDAHWPHTRSTGLSSYLKNSIEDTYLAEVSFLDQQLARLFAYLKQSDKLSETLIIFTADHGENFYEHDNPLTHQNLYEDVVKIPLILYHPNLKQKKTSSLVQHTDIFPTILEFLKIKFNQKIDGVSLLPLINSTKQSIHKVVFFEDIVYRRIKFSNFVKRRRGLRNKKYKYIATYKGSEKEIYKINLREDQKIYSEELYDLSKDPLEQLNIANIKPNIIKSLRKDLTKTVLHQNFNRIINDPLIGSKVKNSVSILKQAFRKYPSKKLIIAWKGGKDTTVMMHIIRCIFKEEIPIRVFFNDTTLEFKETYQFIEKIKKLWNLNLVVIKHDKKELLEYYKTKDLNKKKELSRIMKITVINKALEKYKLKGFLLGIRKDENPARKNEKYFSKRKNHIRIHPLLDWTESDIWYYTQNMGVPYSVLYDQGYRSVGEQPFTSKSYSNERSGREQEKEASMGRLRKLGYW